MAQLPALDHGSGHNREADEVASAEHTPDRSFSCNEHASDTDDGLQIASTYSGDNKNRTISKGSEDCRDSEDSKDSKGSNDNKDSGDSGDSRERKEGNEQTLQPTAVCIEMLPRGGSCQMDGDTPRNSQDIHCDCHMTHAEIAHCEQSGLRGETIAKLSETVESPVRLEEANSLGQSDNLSLQMGPTDQASEVRQLGGHGNDAINKEVACAQSYRGESFEDGCVTRLSLASTTATSVHFGMEFEGSEPASDTETDGNKHEVVAAAIAEIAPDPVKDSSANMRIIKRRTLIGVGCLLCGITTATVAAIVSVSVNRNEPKDDPVRVSSVLVALCRQVVLQNETQAAVGNEIYVDCTGVPKLEMDKFRFVNGPNASVGACRYDCSNGDFLLEPAKRVHYWSVGSAQQSCSEVCSSMDGCISDDRIWPRSADSIQAISEQLLYRCRTVSVGPEGTVPSFVDGTCFWPRELPVQPCNTAPSLNHLPLCPCRAPPAVAPFSEMKLSFASFDIDKSGNIELWEIAKYLAHRDQAAQSMKDIDKNGDGVISFAEVQALHKHMEDNEEQQALAEVQHSKQSLANGSHLRRLGEPTVASLLLVAAKLLASKVALEAFVGVRHHPRAWALATSEPGWNGWAATKRLDAAEIEKHLPDGFAGQPAIANLFTVGAPGATRPALRNYRALSGCFPGTRLVTENFMKGFGRLFGWMKRDIIAWLASLVGYEHPAQTVLFVNVDDSEHSTLHSCSKDRSNSNVPRVDLAFGARLHTKEAYEAGLSGLEAHLHKEDDSHCNQRGFRRAPSCVTECYSGRWRDWCYTSSRRGWWAPWKACNTCSPCRHGWEPATGCAESFEYKGRWYHGCSTTDTADDAGQAYGWCSIDSHYQGVWRLCKSQCSTNKTTDNAKAALMKKLAVVVRRISYRSYEDLGIVKACAGQQSLRVVAKAYTELNPLGSDPQTAWLLQDTNSLACSLTFTGSDSDGDWLQNFRFFPSAFCGFLDEGDEKHLQDGHVFAHRGFRDQVRRLVQSSEYQTYIRPRLSSCTAVMPVGHSLGGAMAELFAACANRAPQRGQAGYTDYAYIGWKHVQPQLLPELDVGTPATECV